MMHLGDPPGGGGGTARVSTAGRLAHLPALRGRHAPGQQAVQRRQAVQGEQGLQGGVQAPLTRRWRGVVGGRRRSSTRPCRPTHTTAPWFSAAPGRSSLACTRGARMLRVAALALLTPCPQPCPHPLHWRAGRADR